MSSAIQKLGTVMMLAGGLALGIAAYRGATAGYTVATGVRVEGNVHRTLGSGRAMTSDAVIDFPKADGQSMRILRLVDGDLREGDAVRIAYLSAVPGAARVLSFWSLGLVPLILSVFGTPLFLIGRTLRNAAQQSDEEKQATSPLPSAASDTRPTKMAKPVLAVVLFLGLFALLWLFLGLKGVSDYVKITQHAEPLNGIIEDVRTEHTEHRDSKGRSSSSTSYYATVRYEDPKQGSTTFEQALLGDQEMLETGDRAALDYVQGDPPLVSIVGTHELWRELIPLLAGACFLAAAWGVAQAGRR